MCELCLPRRSVLAGGAALTVAALAGRVRPGAAAAAPAPVAAAMPAARAGASSSPVQAAVPAIVSRATWGAHLVPTGPIPDEPDVRFLLVHHTVSANDYPPEAVVPILEDIFRFHTGGRGWPDIAYNFFVDRFGTIYEGRSGSLAGAKAADATGGSQGFAQLVSFIGDHSVAPPSDAAFASMVAMLAWLGDRHALDLAPGATATFVSRGSNRQPAGTEVTTPTISGHRDMSATACPGDFAYASVADGTFARLATAARTPPPPPPTQPPPTEPPTTAAPPTTAPQTSTVPTSTTPPPPTSTTVAAPEVAAPSTVEELPADGPELLVPASVAGAAALAAGALALRLRHRR